MQYTHAQTDNPMSGPRIELATAPNEMMLNWRERKRKRELNEEQQAATAGVAGAAAIVVMRIHQKE